MFYEPHASANKSLRIAIVSGDRTLEEEFRAALTPIPDTRGVVYFASTYRQAVEIARDRQPNLIVVEIDRDVRQVAGVVKDLHHAVPDTVIAAAFTPDRLEQSHSESATIIELLRAQVRDFLRRPLSTTELRSVIDRLLFQQSAPAPVARGRIASFVSNKGGVGKSTLAVSTACGLAARHADEVLLVDLSLQLGTCALMLDLKPETSIVDVIRERDRLDETLLLHLTLRHASGLRLLAAPGDALEAAEVDDETIARILTMARRAFRYVIVDTFPMLDSAVLTTLDLSDVAFVVLQGMAPSVAGAARLLPILDGLGLSPDRQRLVLNYNYKAFVGNLRPADIADRLQRPLDYVVRYERRVLTSMNTGSPQILHAARWHRFARTMARLVEDVESLQSAETGGFPESLLGEENRMRRGVDRRRGIDRRLRDLGRLQGDRRSGRDRRVAQLERAPEREVLT
jgi:pilus assembly protein CpaE